MKNIKNCLLVRFLQFLSSIEVWSLIERTPPVKDSSDRISERRVGPFGRRSR